MKLLPIVGRELRESSRRRGTYWLRVRVASQAVVIGVAAYFINLFNPARKLGTVLFWGLAGVSMLFCLLAGRRSTADCLSQEKREGTLGLLFLTDLKGYDVVLGKLAATSVTGLYALLAVFPLLAVPLLTGGMTSSEVGRMIVVLTNTFFFSIAIGIFASAISREYRTAMAANFLLWLALVGAPVACGFGFVIARSLWLRPFFYSCPIFSFGLCADATYGLSPYDFWWSILVTHLLAWFLVLLACRIVPRTWGDKPERAPSRRWRWRDFGAFISYGSAAGRAAFRKQALDRNAYFWHAARARLKPLHVWLFLVLSGAWWISCWAENGHIWLDETTFIATAVLLSATFKLWITLEAGQRLGEDRRSGAFELLLATPLTVGDILRGQWLALRRQFLKPLLVVIALDLVFIILLRRMRKFDAWAVTALLAVFPLDIAALICVAMRAALTTKGPTHATVVAVFRILILPWLVFGLLHAATAILVLLTFFPWEPNQRFEVAQWFGISVAVDLIFGLQAWLSLRRDFRLLATQTPAPTRLRPLLTRGAACLGMLARRAVPVRVRIPLMAGLAVVAALGVVHFARARHPEFPPPVVVSITQSNGPLRIFRAGGQGVFLVLPDGSLWRWGKTGNPQSPRAAMPEQVGTNRDWVKTAADGRHGLGLRGDGTIWDLDASAGTNAMTPQQAIPGSEWADIAIGGPAYSIALKKDGTLWTWSPSLPRMHQDLAQFGTGPSSYVWPDRPGMHGSFYQFRPASNWTALSSGRSSIFGLRADGTLWVWGPVFSSRNASYWINTNIEAPALLCADTNWISLDADGQARNRAGELWDAKFTLPNPNARAAKVCQRIGSNCANYISKSPPYRMTCQIRTNGTLWTAPQGPGLLDWSLPPPSPTAATQVGRRSDWVAVWGLDGTALGLTADGTLWAWGFDVGRESVVNTGTRIRLLRDLLSGQYRNGANWNRMGPLPPILEQPLPLMKLANAPPP